MWGKFARQPQSVRLRQVCFLIHLWVGMIIGIYVVLISLSGSAVVYRIEIDRAFSRRTVLAAPPDGVRMTDRELASMAIAAYSRFKVDDVQIHARAAPDATVEIWLISGPHRLGRLFNPYTGQDLGDMINTEPGFVSWLVKLHADLLGERLGRRANGIGALLVTLLCVTGMIVWWPGLARWKRSTRFSSSVGWRRLNWDLHSALGFWLLVPILIWTATGIYMTFPQPFENFIALFEIDGTPTNVSLSIDALFAWLVRLHFGRTFGPWVKALWAVVGVIPPALFITGSLMWWNRTLRRRWRNLFKEPLQRDRKDSARAELLPPLLTDVGSQGEGIDASIDRAVTAALDAVMPDINEVRTAPGAANPPRAM